MKYKNLNLAFLYDVVIGFGCIISVSQLGFSGLISLVLVGLKPFFLEQETIKDEKDYWRFSYRVMLSSIIIISLFIIAVFILINLFPAVSKKLPPAEKILYLLIPFFLMTKGVIGFIYNQRH